jgi:hypothetical protein
VSWAQIARAYETGWTPPTRPKRPHKRPSTPRVLVIEGEAQRLTEWANDPRNIHSLAPSTLAKRASDEANLVSVEVFLRAPLHGRKY